MSRYRKSTPVPFIAAGVLLAGFVGLVFWATRGGRGEPGGTVRAGEAFSLAAPVPPEPAPRRAEPEPEVRPAPPARPSAARAEEVLRQATVEWRAFALDLCRQQRWPTERAVGFLERTTWNDRDPEKQHAHGLASLRVMLGTDTEDPVALAEALAAKGDLRAWFAESWSRVDVEWKPETKEAVLEDAWKPNRIRWGYPLDTPIETLQEFKLLSSAALDAWQGLAWTYVDTLEIDDDAKTATWQAAVGDGVVKQELKMQAALRVLLDKPDASMKDAVEEFFRLAGENQGEALSAAMGGRMPAALEAATKAG